MAQIYVQLKAIKPGETESLDYIFQLWEVPDGTYLTALEFGIADRGEREVEYRPVIRTPFVMHGDIKTLHTICRRKQKDDRIDILER